MRTTFGGRPPPSGAAAEARRWAASAPERAAPHPRNVRRFSRYPCSSPSTGSDGIVSPPLVVFASPTLPHIVRAAATRVKPPARSACTNVVAATERAEESRRLPFPVECSRFPTRKCHAARFSRDVCRRHALALRPPGAAEACLRIPRRFPCFEVAALHGGR